MPSAYKLSNAQFLDEACALLARLAMGSLDGNRRGSRFPPTALRCATWLGNTVGESAEDPDLGPAYSVSFGHGYTVEQLFAGAAAKLESPLSLAGHEVLAEFYLRIQDDIATAAAEKGAPPTRAEVSEILAGVLVRDVYEETVDGDGLSLWIQFMQACYPDSAQLRLALAQDPHADSSANPFAPWEKPPGTF
jgi:hypothetical protein